MAFVVSAINSRLVLKAKVQQFEAARQEVRQAWLNQGPQNPHNAAHYGHYVFKPIYSVHALDNGIDQFAGSIVRLEGHAQNEPNFSLAENRTESSRFGEMSFSWLLQILMPLFIILLCFNAVSADKEQQNLKLLVAQGTSARQYLGGKIIANFLVVIVLALVGLGIQYSAISSINDASSTAQDAVHSLAWFAVFIIYFLIISCLSVLGSAWATSSKNSLLLQVAVWALVLVIMPKLTAYLGTQLHPMEQRSAFGEALRSDREKGINGHNPEDERTKQFEEALLKKYKVDSLNKLPINADGLIMQADED